jgi:5-methylcytosine-specific restriction endonuclease McrA
MTTAPALMTLLLNADYQPLSTRPLSLISGREAVEKVYRERVTVVEEWDAAFRSPSRTIKIPKVVALNVYSPVAAEPKFCRRSIFLRDGYKCQYCGDPYPASELTFDHVIPKSAGGKTTWENILSACVKCNLKKRDRMPNYSGRRGSDKHGMRPLKEPRKPTTRELLAAGIEFLNPTIKEEWGDWIYWTTDLE